MSELIILDTTLSAERQRDAMLVLTPYLYDEIDAVSILGHGDMLAVNRIGFDLTGSALPRLLAPTMEQTEQQAQTVIVLGAGRIFDLADWILAAPQRHWILVQCAATSLHAHEVSTPQFTLATLDQAWHDSPSMPLRRQRRPQFVQISSGASYQWDFDWWGYPLLYIPPLAAYWSLFPLTKIQFERYWHTADTHFNNAWYADRLQANPRVSYRQDNIQSYEQLFITSLWAEEAQQVAHWAGLSIPTISQWRTAYRWLQAQPAILPPPSLRGQLDRSAQLIWTRLFDLLRPQTMLDLSLMCGGMIEWVADGSQFAGLGKPRPVFHKMLGDPLVAQPIRPIRPNARLKHFGMRLFLP